MYNDSYNKVEKTINAIFEKFGTYDPYEIAAKSGIQIKYVPLPDEVYTILFTGEEDNILLLVLDTMIQEYQEYLITYQLAQYFMHNDIASYIVTLFDLNEKDFTKEVEENYIFSFYLLKRYHKGITDEEMIKKYRVRENLKKFMM